MNKPYNIQNTNMYNGIFHISFFKALLINEGETTRGETTHGVNGIRGETTRIRFYVLLNRIIDMISSQALGSRIFFFLLNFINKMCIYNVYEPV
jgi:hypothetical protein